MEKFYMKNRQRVPPSYTDCVNQMYKDGNISYNTLVLAKQQRSLNTDDQPPNYSPPPPPTEERTPNHRNREPPSVLSSDQYYPVKENNAKVITDNERYPVASVHNHHEARYAQIRAVRSPGNRDNQQYRNKRNSYYDDVIYEGVDSTHQVQNKSPLHVDYVHNHRGSVPTLVMPHDRRDEMVIRRNSQSENDHRNSGHNPRPLSSVEFRRNNNELELNGNRTGARPSRNTWESDKYYQRSLSASNTPVRPASIKDMSLYRTSSQDSILSQASSISVMSGKSSVNDSPRHRNNRNNSAHYDEVRHVNHRDPRYLDSQLENDEYLHDMYRRKSSLEQPYQGSPKFVSSEKLSRTVQSNIAVQNEPMQDISSLPAYPHQYNNNTRRRSLEQIHHQSPPRSQYDNNSPRSQLSFSVPQSPASVHSKPLPVVINDNSDQLGKDLPTEQKGDDEKQFQQKYVNRYTCRYERVGADSYRKADVDRNDKGRRKNTPTTIEIENSTNRYQPRSLSFGSESSDISSPIDKVPPPRRGSTNPFLDSEEDNSGEIQVQYTPHIFLPDDPMTDENLNISEFVDAQVTANEPSIIVNQEPEDGEFTTAASEDMTMSEMTLPIVDDDNDDVGPPPPPRKHIPINNLSLSKTIEKVTDSSPDSFAKSIISKFKKEHKSKRKANAKKVNGDVMNSQTLQHRKSMPDIHSSDFVHPKSMTLPRKAIEDDHHCDTSDSDNNSDKSIRPLNSINPFISGSLPLLDQVGQNGDDHSKNQSTEELSKTEVKGSVLDLGFEPGVVLRQLKLLLDAGKFPQAVALIDKMPQKNLTEILPSIALDDVMEKFPDCVSFLFTIFDKLDLTNYPEDFEELPIRNLNVDNLMKNVVKYFAKLSDPSEKGEIVLPSDFDEHLDKILKVVAHFNPQLKSAIYKRKRTLEQCLTGLGKHGYVSMSDGKLVQLQEALKSELTRHFHLCKNTIPKVEEILPKTPVKSNKHSKHSTNGSKNLPPEASHQRMLNFTQKEVEDRLIKNRALFSAFDAFSSSNHVQKLNLELDERIRCDKFILLHFNELKKQMKFYSRSICMAPVFQNYATAFSKLLESLQSDDCSVTQEDDVFDGSEIDVETWDTASCISSSRHPLKSSSSSLAQSIRGTSGYSSLDINKQANEKCDTNSVNQEYSSSVSTLTMGEQSEIETLRSEVYLLKKELHKARDLNEKLETRERLLKERLSEKAEHNVQCGSTFEDLNLGDSRPTQLIRRYSNLYSQTRVDALDALDSNEEINEFDDLKVKLLFSVVVLAFRTAQDTIDDFKSNIRQMLYLPSPEDPPEAHSDATKEIQENVMKYLRKTTERFDHNQIVDAVSKQLWATLYDYPSLRELQPLLVYIDECAQVAWALIIQNPPFALDYESTIYNDSHHTRFYLSDSESPYIKSFMWPTLLEHENGPCLFKGVVVT